MAGNTLVTLGVQNAAPPTDTYISEDDQLFVFIVNSFANATVIITVRLLLPDGTIGLNQFQFAPSSTRVPNQFQQALAEGFLLSVTATGGGNVLGQTYVVCTLVRNLPSGTFPATGAYGEILLQGYVSNKNTLTFPRGQFGGTLTDRGNLRSITGTLPAAGAEISETVPANAYWSLMLVRFSLTASATVANRFPHLLIDDGVNILFDSVPNTAVTAGQTISTSTGNGVQNPGQSDNVQRIALPVLVFMGPGYRLRTLTTAIQVGDQYTAPQYQVQEWING